MSNNIKKIFNKYQIQLSIILDSINIQIQKEDSFGIYVSKFNIEYLQQHKLLMPNLTIEEMINFIGSLIDLKNIKIEENNINMKLILISTLPNNPNVKLILNKKELLSNEIIEKIINEIKYLKEENSDLKKNNIELNKRIKLIEEEKINKDNKINEMEKRIERLEKFHKYETKIQLTSSNLTNIKSIQPHNNWINSISCFPSGNIISVSHDKSINIYDINLNILQKIKNAHDKCIIYVEIKDENNFITCSTDKNIKLWIKNNNEFKMNKIIKNAHEDQINKIIYCLNKNLISCSWDKNIKIWKENNNNNYECINTLTHSAHIDSLLLFEDKNILISSGGDGTKFWDLNNYNNINCIKDFKETWCGWHGGLCKLDEDRIIVKTAKNQSLSVISILKKEIIKVINHPFECCVIYLIEDKGIFLVGGKSKDIIIYRNDNYECIQTIKNAHDDVINLIELKNKLIASSSNDKTLKIWSF